LHLFIDNFILKQSPVKSWNEFILFPWKSGIYKNDLYWVPPLISEDKKLFNPAVHPFHKNAEVNLFLLYQDNKPVARVAAIIIITTTSSITKKPDFSDSLRASIRLKRPNIFWMPHPNSARKEEWNASADR